MRYNTLMQYEFSAGGIVYKKDTEQTLILIAQHSQHHGWVFPKGFIGDTIPGESKEAAALREVQEETGVVGNILQALTPITYEYTMDGKKRKKTVYYYIMEYVQGDVANHDWEMEKVEWLAMADIEKRLTYDSDKQVWEEAKKIVQILV